MLRRRSGVLLVPVLALLACPAPQGEPGPAGTPGTEGQAGCTPPPGELGLGLRTSIETSEPANGAFFVAGERIRIIIRFEDRCHRVMEASDLTVANFYIVGPRTGLRTKTAVKLLNAPSDRGVANDQHHYINLAEPRYADPTQGNLGLTEEGSLIFTTAPITDEAPGTYSVSVWARTADEMDQSLETVDIQIGTSVREDYASGRPGAFPACGRCHWGPSNGKINMRHSKLVHGGSEASQANLRGMPLGLVMGNWVLDSTPIASCLLCHNRDGYSPIPLAVKIHSIHRGNNMKTPGIAHPELGLPLDASMQNYTMVRFPAMPEAEKECTQCHTDDRWKTSPSPLACIGCHETLFLDRGTLEPPRNHGQPSTGPCTINGACAMFGQYATCNTGTGLCETATHPLMTAEPDCARCHTPDMPGTSPIATRHAISYKVQSLGLQITDFSASGSSGPNGTFMPGDIMVLRFKLSDRSGNLITDVKTNAAWRLDLIVAGPTEQPQRLIGGGPPASKTPLSYDTGSGMYSYALPALPTGALAPLNSPTGTPGRATNPPGTYMILLFVSRQNISGPDPYQAATTLQSFKLGADLPIRPRNLIVRTACLGCHVEMSAHGGMRREPEGCPVCHTSGTTDRIAGARGRACTSDAQCGGFAQGWEACRDTTNPPDGTPDTCVIINDPTPNQSAYLPNLIHSIHYARRRAGYSARDNLIPGTLTLVGFTGPKSFDEGLVPFDIRNCPKCHLDTATACTVTSECSVGQQCRAGQCKNVAWLEHTVAAACLACHDDAAAFAHAALQTYLPPTGPPAIESCPACHAEDREFSSAKVHAIASPYRPPYDRLVE